MNWDFSLMQQGAIYQHHDSASSATNLKVHGSCEDFPRYDSIRCSKGIVKLYHAILVYLKGEVCAAQLETFSGTEFDEGIKVLPAAWV